LEDLKAETTWDTRCRWDDDNIKIDLRKTLEAYS